MKIKNRLDESVSNGINSLVTPVDWREFVETMSVVEQILKKDVDGVYGTMDFYTRDQYRHKIEEIAKNSQLQERDIAQTAINFAHQHFAEDNKDTRKSHVGYYLIKSGVKQTEKAADVQLSVIQLILKALERYASILYIGTAVLLTLTLEAGLYIIAQPKDVTTSWHVTVALLSLLHKSSCTCHYKLVGQLTGKPQTITKA